MTDYLKLAREARELAKKATPGPWYLHETKSGIFVRDDSGESRDICIFGDADDDNALLAIHARDHYPALCDAIEAQAGELVVLASMRDALADQIKAQDELITRQMEGIQAAAKELEAQAAEIERLRSALADAADIAAYDANEEWRRMHEEKRES